LFKKSSILCDITLCSPLKSEEHVASIFRAEPAACYLLHAGFFLGLLFDPEDEGDMFL
jgi:hypothetical protein